MPASMPPDGFEDDGPPDGFDDEKPSYGTKNIIGEVARPLLEGGGAVAGGILGSPMGPIGAAGGGALGFGIGKSAADLLDRGLGRKEPIPNLPAAIGEAGQNAYQGAQVEASGLAASKIIPPILKGAGKVRNLFGEWANGIPRRDYETLAEHPMAMRPGALKQAGETFDAAATNAGISSELTPEAVDRIRHPGQYAFDTFNELKTKGSISPQQALHARQSLDAAYPVPNKKNGSYIRMLDQMRDAFQGVIANASPELKQASKDYAIAKSGSRFQAVLPQNKNGTPSFFRSGAMISGLLSGHPEALFMSPGVAGTTTALTGAAGKGINSVLRNPASRRLVTSGVRSLLKPKPQAQAGVVNPSNSVPQPLNGQANGGYEKNGGKNLPGNISDQATPKRLLRPRTEKVLTDVEAKNYLKKARGDRSKARQLAVADGWTIPE
jgi:hypothetical protein